MTDTNIIDFKSKKLELNEDVSVEDVLNRAMERSDDIASIVLVIEMEDGPSIVRYSSQKNSDLVWASRVLQRVADDLVEEDMEG